MSKRIVAVGVVVFAAVLLTPAATAAEKGLVAYWPMDEGKGDVIKDEGGNGHDGIIKGAEWVEGKFGTGLAFDGLDDVVDCDETLMDEDVNAFTVTLWIKIESWSNGAGIVYIGKDVYAGHAAVISTGTSGGRSIDYSYDHVLDHQEVFYSDQAWHHMAGVYDGSYARLYKDGEEVYNEEYTEAVDFSDCRTILGSRLDLHLYFNGVLDEVRIYNRALTSKEITALAEAGEK